MPCAATWPSSGSSPPGARSACASSWPWSPTLRINACRRSPASCWRAWSPPCAISSGGRRTSTAARLVEATRDGAACERLTAVPGVGPVIATALVAAVGKAKSFSSGRHLAAWLGLVPRQRSSGGKERLLGLSKRGDGYLRRQLMHGARALVRISQGREGRLWSWINGLLGRRAFNVVVAAVANKLARILWALLSRGETYRVTM